MKNGPAFFFSEFFYSLNNTDGFSTCVLLVCLLAAKKTRRPVRGLAWTGSPSDFESGLGNQTNHVSLKGIIRQFDLLVWGALDRFGRGILAWTFPLERLHHGNWFDPRNRSGLLFRHVNRLQDIIRHLAQFEKRQAAAQNISKT